MNDRGWIGVDLDGTLAHYEGWRGIEDIGDPIPKMMKRVVRWLKKGKQVKIMTARVSGEEGFEACRYVRAWLKEHLPAWEADIEITCKKDYRMWQLWDDRCVQVIPNTGERVDGCK